VLSDQRQQHITDQTQCCNSNENNYQ